MQSEAVGGSTLCLHATKTEQHWPFWASLLCSEARPFHRPNRPSSVACSTDVAQEGRTKSGFHACEYPLDVFTYYAPGESNFAEVELGDASDKTNLDSKLVGKSITVKAALSVPALVSASIEFTTSKCLPAASERATGYQSASSATGKFAVAAAFGLEPKAMAGKDGTIIVAWWDKATSRIRYTIGYVGESGVEADVWYRANENGELVKTNV